MTGIIPVAAGIIVCVFFSAYFSSAEMAYSACNVLRLENLRDGGSDRAKVAMWITGHFDDALSAILIGNNLANIGASSLSSVLVLLLTGSDSYTWLATVILTLVIITFGETMPKIVTKKNPNSSAMKKAYFIRALMFVLKPLIWLVVTLIHLITGSLRGEDADETADEAVEELQSIIETAEDEDVLDEDQSELIQAAIDFAQVSAFEVMTARVDVGAIDIDDDWEEIIRRVETSPYSRIPVYEDSIDRIIGVLYMNRFLKALTDEEKPDIRSLLMPTCYVYKTMKLPAVLSALRKAKQHLAIVTDEYGGTLGVVSMEDVLEQIVGEIWDDNDTVEQEIVSHGSGEYELDGDMVISDFIELCRLNEDEFDYDSGTLGGWVIEMFGGFPKAGDSFIFEDMRVSVLTMTDGRRVDKVLVEHREEQ